MSHGFLDVYFFVCVCFNMQHDSCREALHKVRLDCSSLPTEQERTACKQQMNVHEVSTNCKCNNTPTECVIAGNTQRQYACVPGSTEPQVVFGMGMMGKISKIN